MIKFMRWPLLALLLSVVFAPEARANTYVAASCNVTDVQAAVNLTSNGDTVAIPACPSGVNWTNALNITDGITLTGQGAASTVIIDGTSKGNSNCQGVTPLIQVTLNSNVPVRITSFEIIGQLPIANCGESAEHILISGSSQQVRIDHITFNPVEVTAINFAGFTSGVVDHNTFNEPANESPRFPTEVHYDSWQGVGNYGDNSWATPDTMGMPGTIANPTSAATAVYIENNTYSYNSNYFPTGCFDSESGGRVVFRFNINCPFVGWHGLDSSARLRSLRHFEIYNNTFTAINNPLQNMYTGVFSRGGTGMLFNNNFVDIPGSPYITEMLLTNYRSTSNLYPPWGISYTGTGCDGRSPWDTNTGITYVSGQYNGSSGNTETVTDTTQNWTVNQWVGYSVVNLSGTLNSVSTWGAAILSNTATTLTTISAAQGSAHHWTAGDGYKILKAYPCADQVGRGTGLLVRDLASGDGMPVLNTTGAVGALNQASDPVYAWDNQHNGGSFIAALSLAFNTPAIAANRDYYDYSASFNGTSGVGSGTLAARPSTCTIGAGYWATDQGNWNQSGMGGQGELFVCTAPNIWTLYYVPYTYPHPLTASGGGTAPVSPGGPQAIPH